MPFMLMHGAPSARWRSPLSHAAAVQEGERDLALRVYAMAMRAKVSTLRVHTVALGACLLRAAAVDTRASDLATAVTVHRNVQVRPRLVSLVSPVGATP